MGASQRYGAGNNPLGAYQKVRLPNHFPKTPQDHEDNIRELERIDWGSANGTRWATIVIAASDSTENSKATADYVCGGSGDQAVINAAITALQGRSGTIPAGRIVLLEGTYYCSSSISCNALGIRTLVIVGMGAGGFGSSLGATKVVATSSSPAFSFAGSSAAAGSNVIIRDIHIATGSGGGIRSADMPMTVENCVITGATYAYLSANTTGTGGASRFSRNYVYMSAAVDAVTIGVGASSDIPTIISENIIQITGNGRGIVTQNQLSTIPTYCITDNVVFGTTATGSGVGIETLGNSSENSVISGNLVRTINTGISVAGYRNNVSGNIVESAVTGYRTSSDSQYLGFMANLASQCTTAFVLANNAIRPTILGNKAAVCTTAYTVASGVTSAFIGYNDFGGATGTDSGTGTQTPQGIPSGGTSNQVLKKNSSTDYDVSWALDPTMDLAAAKGDILVATAVDVLAAMSVGRDQTVLMADSSQSNGRKNGPAIYVQSTDPSLTYTTAVGDIWIDTT